MKNIITEIANKINMLASKLEPAKERISELEERAEEIIQNPAHKEKEKNWERSWDIGNVFN